MATSLKNIERTLKNLEKIQPVFVKAGWKAIEEIRDNWLNEKGADDKKVKGLSKAYNKIKQKRTGRGIADFHLTGNMAQSMQSKPLGKYGALITFDSAYEKEKAAGNARHRPNMMTPSERLAGVISDYIMQEIRA
jgi:hypothetical protein